jgi:hypothetical protein
MPPFTYGEHCMIKMKKEESETIRLIVIFQGKSAKRIAFRTLFMLIGGLLFQ